MSKPDIILAVRGTGGGVKVIERDHTGLADGFFTKRNRRYFYGEDAEQKAHNYAENTAEKIRDVRDVAGVEIAGITQRVKNGEVVE